MNEMHRSINYNDYSNLELTCQHHLLLALALRDGEILQTRMDNLVSRKNMEYLVADVTGGTRELCLDKIVSFSHPQIDTVVISES